MGARPTPADIAIYNTWAKRNNEDAWGVKRGNPDGPKQQILEELRVLADNRNIRDARKLYQLAKAQEIRGVTQALATEALSSSGSPDPGPSSSVCGPFCQLQARPGHPG
jgi:hypothetical protein